MANEDDKTIVLEEFNGLYARGQPDTVPQDHAWDCLNLEFQPGQVASRGGMVRTVALPTSGCRRFFMGTFGLGSKVLLTLDELGNIAANGAIILTIPGIDDFVAINMFNRIYITPLIGSHGTGNLQVYDGTDIHDVAGLAPVTPGLTAVPAAAAGNVAIGKHKVAVAYLTDSQFITPPGPIVAGTFTPATSTQVDSVHKITVTGIPVGGPDVIARWLLVTKADELEFFFVPFNGFINDNVTTTIDINFFDTDLVISADYLFDLMQTVPNIRSLNKYHGRLIAVANNNVVLVSLSGDPESISSVNGFIQLPYENDGNDATASFVLRDDLYVTKFEGIFAVPDTGDPPSFWPVNIVDASVGAFHHGISAFDISAPAKDAGDIVLLASAAGLMLFDGVARRPELTWKIQDIWRRINGFQFPKITVTHDIWLHRIYINMPLDNAADPNIVFVADYSEAFDNLYFTIPNPMKVKWCPWKFHRNPTVIGMAIFNEDEKYTFRMASVDANSSFIWSLDPNSPNDDCNIIDAHWDHALLSYGGYGFFNMMRFRVIGVGQLLLNIKGYDRLIPQDLTPFTLSLTPGQDLSRKMIFTNERMSIRFGTNAICDKFMVQRIEVFGSQAWQERPA